MGLLLKLSIALVIAGLITFISIKLDDNYCTTFWEPINFIGAIVSACLCFAVFIVGLLSLCAKSTVEQDIKALDNYSTKINIIYSETSDNPGFILLCKEEIDSYNTYLENKVSIHKNLQLSTVTEFEKYYYYEIDLDTLELKQKPTSITNTSN